MAKMWLGAVVPNTVRNRWNVFEEDKRGAHSFGAAVVAVVAVAAAGNGHFFLSFFAVEPEDLSAAGAANKQPLLSFAAWQAITHASSILSASFLFFFPFFLLFFYLIFLEFVFFLHHTFNGGPHLFIFCPHKLFLVDAIRFDSIGIGRSVILLLSGVGMKRKKINKIKVRKKNGWISRAGCQGWNSAVGCVCVCVACVFVVCVCVCVCVCVIVGGQPSVDLAMNYSVPKSKSYRVFNRRLPFGPNLHERIVTPL